MAEVVFLGDDFTGASDSLATYASKGWPARLVMNGNLRTEGIEALGLATDLRSLDPERARDEIARLWPWIAKADPRILHFKVCSTFDSSLSVGSIGGAVVDLIDRFEPDVVALIGGQPSLGRYCVFGNLFATGPDGKVHRIDRHPVMSRHPVTPMTEADLVRHLVAQGLSGLAPIPFTALEDISMSVDALKKGPVLFDVMTPRDQDLIAAALRAAGGRQLLIGASSVAELVADPSGNSGHEEAFAPPISRNLVVFAGSRSVNTRIQIENARSYRKIELTPENLGADRSVEEAASVIEDGSPLLVHLLPDADYRLSPTALADASSLFMVKLLDRVEVGYLGLAGGDTSSRIATRLGFDALDFERSIDVGTCVCVARHGNPWRDRIRVMLKGGQMGKPDLFDHFANQVGLRRESDA